MKRYFIALVCIIFLVTGCGSQQNQEPGKDVLSNTGTSSESGSLYDPALQVIEENIISRLNGDIPYSEVVVSRKDEIFGLSITIKGSDYITDFGNFVISAKSAFEKEFPAAERERLIVALMDDDGKDMAAFSTFPIGENVAGDYGLFRDARSGSAKYTQIKNEGELCDLFPATSFYISKSTLDPNDIKIYDEVWEVLDAQYNRPEEEIFNELAPRYDMTAEELKQFISDMTEKIYQ